MTFDVVTRYTRAELPYAIAFHSHYTNAGANRIFYILSDPRNLDGVSRELCQALGEALFENFQLVPIVAEPNMALSLFDLSLVQSKYFVSIDMDEYINPGRLRSAMPDLVDSSAEGYINICWKISCSDFSLETRKHSYPCNISKVAAKTYLVDSIIGPHSIRMKSGVSTSPRNKERDIEIVHYWARSFDDILLKCIYQALPNEKYVPWDYLVDPGNHGLPMRLKLLAYMSSCEKIIDNQDYISRLSNESLAKEMALGVLSGKTYIKLWKMYDAYKRRISKTTATSLCARLGPLALAKWINQNGEEFAKNS